ncbi:hypothetical protein WK52_07485 [Burkholderia multivorans]|nr:hypothetical protein WK52_07485 [Burkholderia multivorans]
MFCPKDCFANSERDISWRPFESTVNRLSFLLVVIVPLRAKIIELLRERFDSGNQQGIRKV